MAALIRKFIRWLPGGRHGRAGDTTPVVSLRGLPRASITQLVGPPRLKPAVRPGQAVDIE